MAKCPAHRDDSPSLSITEEGGKVLVHCFGGCSQEAVIEALKAMGVWPEQERPRVYTEAPPQRSSPELREAAALTIWSAIQMGEQVLVDLKATLFVPTDEPDANLAPSIRWWTDLLSLWNRMDPESQVEEYLSWKARDPDLIAAMITAAKIDRAGRQDALRYLLLEMGA